MDFDFLNILIPIITFIVVGGISFYVIYFSGLRAVWAAIIYFGLIGIYQWYTLSLPNLNLYTYILDNIKGDTTKDKILWFAFFILIFIIQFFMLFDYSIKNMGRSFNGEAFGMCISLCLLCNILLSTSAVSQSFANVALNELKNPAFSTLIMMGIFLTTFFIMFILRQFISM